jgi:protoporphyrinogen/coproporphyrinogen III oxidase
MSTPNKQKHVVIIGGGLAGLSAAWYLQDSDCRVTIVEASNNIGGKVQSQILDTPSGEAIIETGPDGFLTRKPWAYQLAQDIGLSDELIGVNDTPERIYILTKNGLQSMPKGMYLLVPTDLDAFRQSDMFTLGGKLRMAVEQYIPPKADDEDESLADFITRRLGAEALDKLGEPLLAGVFNADPDKQSILATFPNFRKIEREYGSLIKGMQAIQARQTSSPSQPPLVSFKGGMGTFAKKLSEELTCDIRLNSSVQAIMQADNGYSIALDDTTLHADQLIIATQADTASQLMKTIAPDTSKHLAKIRYSGIASVTLAYRRDDVEHPLDAYGVVVPSSVGVEIDGIQFASSKWEHRAPDDIALIRAFFGGPQTRHMLNHDDETALGIVKAELARLLNITGEPLNHRLLRWEQGYPQYDVGHLDLIAQIEASLPDGLYLAGNAYHGVGVPDTVHYSQQVARKISE